MLKLESLATLIAVVEAGSVGGAARRIGVSKSVVSERLTELERSVGASLVQRSSRKLSLTEDGTAFYERARRILNEVDGATTEIAERRGKIAGPLRLAAPVSFGVLHLGPALFGFLAKHPRLELTLDVDDRLVNVMAEGYDAFVRHGRIVDEHVIVHRLAASRRVLVAAPAYVGRFGKPRSLDELKLHRGILYSNRGAGDWRFKESRRFTTVRPQTVVMRVNNGLLMRDSAAAGLGIALLPTYFIQPELARGRLVALDVGAEPEGATLYLAYPHDRRGSAKLRALTEWLRAAFGDPPYWDAPSGRADRR